MTNTIQNEGWAVADRAADFLCVDRAVCRRAFYREPEERVREVVTWILSEEQEDLPDSDLEWMIELWAREYGAGVYRRDRRCGGLEQVEGILARAVFGRDAAA